LTLPLRKTSKFQQKQRLFAGDCVPGDETYLCYRNSDRWDGTSIACEWGMAGRLAGGRTGPYDEARWCRRSRKAVARSVMQGLKINLAHVFDGRSRTAAEVRAAGDDDKKRTGDRNPGTAVITKTKTQTKRPNLYRVLILNDDYTPMEFVVHILERFFNKDREAATQIMLHVHHHGIGECGVFTYEVAETKVTQVMDFARKHQHPLQCVMEKK
jgi:ATP-dependent Clp protease adaptor protein ClpS